MGGSWLNADGEPTVPMAEPCGTARHPRTWDLLWGTPGRAGLGCCACLLIAILVIVPLLLLVLGPSVVEMFFNAATLRVVNMTLADPTASRLYVEIYAEVRPGPGSNIPHLWHTQCSARPSAPCLPALWWVG